MLCIAEKFHTALNKLVDTFEFRENSPDSTFYDTIMWEGVQIA